MLVDGCARTSALPSTDACACSLHFISSVGHARKLTATPAPNPATAWSAIVSSEPARVLQLCFEARAYQLRVLPASLKLLSGTCRSQIAEYTGESPTICMLQQYLHLPPGREQHCIEQSNSSQRSSHALEEAPHSLMLQCLHRHSRCIYGPS